VKKEIEGLGLRDMRIFALDGAFMEEGFKKMRTQAFLPVE
jgi:hypothetical protein